MHFQFAINHMLEKKEKEENRLRNDWIIQNILKVVRELPYKIRLIYY